MTAEESGDFPEVDLTPVKVRHVLFRMRELRNQEPMKISDPMRRAIIALCNTWMEERGENGHD